MSKETLAMLAKKLRTLSKHDEGRYDYEDDAKFQARAAYQDVLNDVADAIESALFEGDK